MCVCHIYIYTLDIYIYVCMYMCMCACIYTQKSSLSWRSLATFAAGAAEEALGLIGLRAGTGEDRPAGDAVH